MGTLAVNGAAVAATPSFRKIGGTLFALLSHTILVSALIYTIYITIHVPLGHTILLARSVMGAFLARRFPLWGHF